MGERTGIGWTNATWNPWHGCTKVSPGCAHCYMFRDKVRYGQDPEIVQRSKTKFTEPLKWKDPALVFTCSWSDWFHEAADAWRDEAWAIIQRTPHLTYQILTKRPERIIDHLPDDWGDGYPNVWLGVSVESQRYDYRAALLCAVPAAVRFVSAEPLLGRLDLNRVNPFTESEKRRRESGRDDWLGIDVLSYPRHAPISYTPGKRMGRIDWVIVGGESGPDLVRRDSQPDWLAQIVADCVHARIPVFVKQDSGPRDSQQGRIPDDLWARKEFPR